MFYNESRFESVVAIRRVYVDQSWIVVGMCTNACKTSVFRMELTTRYYDPQQYIETANANKVSRVALLCGSQNIKLQGKVRLGL